MTWINVWIVVLEIISQIKRRHNLNKINLKNNKVLITIEVEIYSEGDLISDKHAVEKLTKNIISKSYDVINKETKKANGILFELAKIVSSTSIKSNRDDRK